jgi:hypothetical protein
MTPRRLISQQTHTHMSRRVVIDRQLRTADQDEHGLAGHRFQHSDACARIKAEFRQPQGGPPVGNETHQLDGLTRFNIAEVRYRCILHQYISNNGPVNPQAFFQPQCRLQLCGLASASARRFEG